MSKSDRVDPLLVWMVGGGIIFILICSMISEMVKSPRQQYNETVDHMADRMQYEAEQKEFRTKLRTTHIYGHTANDFQL